MSSTQVNDNIHVSLFRGTPPATTVKRDELVVSGDGWWGKLDKDQSDTNFAHSFAQSVISTSLVGKAPSLLVSDVDSTLINEEVIDQLAEIAHVGAQVSEITERAMRGELDFAQSLKLRVSLLRGLREEAFQEVFQNLTIRRGAKALVDWVHRSGGKVGVVSGGFTPIVSLLANELELDYFLANNLEQEDGLLTGVVSGPIVTAETKSHMLKLWHTEITELSSLKEEHQSPINLSVVALGDGANDIPMLEAADVGVAVCAKPKTKESASAYLDLPWLDAVAGLCGASLPPTM